MKYLFALFLFFTFNISLAQTIEGKWINYKNDQPEVLIEIYENHEGEFEGKVIEIYDQEIQDLICTKCNRDDSRYNKPLMGMVVFTGFQANEKKTKAINGTFLHTRSGKTYKAMIELQNDPNRLAVRGYFGMKAIGKTYIWIRKK